MSDALLGTSTSRIPVAILHRCRMKWPPDHHGVQFAIHLAPGWNSLVSTPDWRWNLCVEFAVWRVDIGIGRA